MACPIFLSSAIYRLQLKFQKIKCGEWWCSWLPRTHIYIAYVHFRNRHPIYEWVAVVVGWMPWFHWCCESQRMSLVACRSPVASHVFWPTFLPTWSTRRDRFSCIDFISPYGGRTSKLHQIVTFKERCCSYSQGKDSIAPYRCFQCTPTHLAHCSSSWVL